MGLNMETQTFTSDQSPSQLITQHQPNALDEALLLLSRLLAKQCALDFMRDPDILNEGGSE
jgi:hypothetical protein